MNEIENAKRDKRELESMMLKAILSYQNKYDIKVTDISLDQMTITQFADRCNDAEMIITNSVSIRVQL